MIAGPYLCNGTANIKIVRMPNKNVVVNARVECVTWSIPSTFVLGEGRIARACMRPTGLGSPETRPQIVDIVLAERLPEG
jgi:hypothetical protein